MNGRRRQIVLATGTLLASSFSPIARAGPREPLVAYIDVDRPTGRSNWEKMQRAVERRFANLRVKPKLISIVAAGNRSDENKLKLRSTLEDLRPSIVVSYHPTLADIVREFKMGLPILFFYVGDPIARGFTDSLVRPSGGMSGYILGASALVKRREMLLRLMPDCKVLGIFDLEHEPGPILYNDAIIANDPFVNLKKRFFYCSTGAEFEKFVLGPEARSVDAWDIPWNLFATQYMQGMVNGFSRIRMPAMYPRLAFLKMGGMVAHEPDSDDFAEVFAGQIAALLDGVPIEQIPIVQSTRYRFGLNLTALRNVGIRPPKSLLKVADTVIQ